MFFHEIRNILISEFTLGIDFSLEYLYLPLIWKIADLKIFAGMNFKLWLDGVQVPIWHKFFFFFKILHL